MVPVAPVQARGAPASFALPAAPSGTLREIVLPADDVQIQQLFNAAQPGDSFIMPDTTVVFGHEPTLKVAGTAANPISLRGSSNAIFASGSGDYGLHLADASYNQVLGGNFTQNKKGIVLDNSKFCTLRYVSVTHVGQEAIHFRSSSSDCLAEYCTIEGAGEENANYGEGFYIGTHNGNWTQQYFDRSSPTQTALGYLGNEDGIDKSNRVILRYNKIINTTGEGLDYKQGVFDCQILSNDFYACGWSGANSADSAIDLKGDNCLIQDCDFYPLMPDGQMPTNPDTGLTYVQRACIQSHLLTSPYGNNNVIKANRAHGTWDSYMFEVVSTSGHTFYDDNVLASGASVGVSLTNWTVTPVGGGGGGEPTDLAGAVSWSASGSITPTIPGTPEAGDYIYIVAMQRSLTAPPATISGWDTVSSGSGTGMATAVYRKLAVGGDTAPTISTGDTAEALGTCTLLIKAATAAPTLAVTYNDSGSSEPTCPDMTAPSGARLVRIIGLGDNQPATGVPTDVTDLVAWTMTTIGSDAGLGTWQKVTTASGSVGTFSATFSGTDPWMGITLVIPS